MFQNRISFFQLANVTLPDLKTTLAIANPANASANGITDRASAKNVTTDSTTIPVAQVSLFKC
jgi:hypothetical protein